MMFVHSREQSFCTKAKEGFTLIELMIAIAILALIVFVAAPNFMAFLDNAKKSNAKETLKSLDSAITVYYAQIGKYPEKLQDLMRAPSDEKIKKKWSGPYLKGEDLPEDPWNESFQYKLTPGGRRPYELYSFGAEGRGSPKDQWISVD